MDMLGGEGIGKQCRTADIMADAAYAILSRPKDATGHFLLDEDVLREEGIQDFDQYAVQPGKATLAELALTQHSHTMSASAYSPLIGRQATRCFQTSS